MESGNGRGRRASSEGPVGNQRRNLKRKLERRKVATQCKLCHRCLEAVGSHRAVSMKCGHIFGRECAEKWLKANNFACPECATISQETDLRILVSGTSLGDLDESDALLEELEAKRRRVEELERELEVLRGRRNFPFLTFLSVGSLLLQLLRLFNRLRF